MTTAEVAGVSLTLCEVPPNPLCSVPAAASPTCRCILPSAHVPSHGSLAGGSRQLRYFLNFAGCEQILYPFVALQSSVFGTSVCIASASLSGWAFPVFGAVRDGACACPCSVALGACVCVFTSLPNAELNCVEVQPTIFPKWLYSIHPTPVSGCSLLLLHVLIKT